MQTFKQFLTEGKSDRTILGQIKLGKNDETDFWNAIGCVLEGSMSKKDEDHIVNDLMRRSKIFVTPILLKAIKKAMKGAPNDCIDKTELAAVKKVFDTTKTPLQRTKDALKAGKDPGRAKASARMKKLIHEAFKWPSKIAKNFRLTPLSIDEWWGIEIDFNWKQKDFYKKWLKSTGGDQKAEIELMEKVAAEAKKSPQWKAFMKKFNKISVDRSSIDNSQVTQYIPNFNPRDFDDWNFNDVGGNISATTRDE